MLTVILLLMLCNTVMLSWHLLRTPPVNTSVHPTTLHDDVIPVLITHPVKTISLRGADGQERHEVTFNCAKFPASYVYGGRAYQKTAGMDGARLIYREAK